MVFITLVGGLAEDGDSGIESRSLDDAGLLVISLDGDDTAKMKIKRLL